LSAREPRARLRFGQDRRLVRREDFERLMKEGTRRSHAGFVFFHAARAGGVARLGILISKRHAALASDRNRIKRCIREAFRLECARMAPIDLLVRPPIGLRPGAGDMRKLRELLVKLGQ